MASRRGIEPLFSG